MCQRWKEVPPTIVGVSIYNGSEQNATVIEVLYVLGGAFQVCKGKEVKRGLMAFIRSSLDGANTLCFNYIINRSRWKGSGCRLMMLRMQNNLIACVIVVFLCIISSSIVGAISVLARMVPAAMVNAYLYLTACVFIIFANCIEHIKVNHIQSKWGPCYPIVNLPADTEFRTHYQRARPKKNDATMLLKPGHYANDADLDVRSAAQVSHPSCTPFGDSVL
ncbi:hypothetical protein ECG_09289 [Echinococcus granulosus]|nr:hypothetical protein ECG_09289 [Echinococcus granulosus]